MGRTCNLYLLDGEGRILDCLRRIGLDDSARPALPGLSYRLPEQVTKKDPENLNSSDFLEILEENGADMLSDRLMANLGGLSPLVCREAALATAGSPGRICRAWQKSSAPFLPCTLPTRPPTIPPGTTAV